ncbi:hypothetical protein [Nostoc sp.]|uniref:hypothetical protein n=1 Tax=Nostoc sp. TaxID=1180 RepID=UPI002FFA5351
MTPVTHGGKPPSLRDAPRSRYSPTGILRRASRREAARLSRMGEDRAGSPMHIKF